MRMRIWGIEHVENVHGSLARMHVLRSFLSWPLVGDFERGQVGCDPEPTHSMIATGWPRLSRTHALGSGNNNIMSKLATSGTGF
jgi:hypothetical protein